MVTVKDGIFNSQTAGQANPGWNSGALQQRGDTLGAPGTNAQLQAMQQYSAMAEGLGPSVAQQQLQAQSEANQRAQMAAINQSRGGNLAGNFNAALSAGAGMQQATNQQAAILRAQEQQAAIAGLGQLGGQVIGQELAFNQLAQQGLATAGQQNIDWQLGKRGLDLQRDGMQFDQNMQIAKSAMQGVGSVVGGAVMSDERAKSDIMPTAQSASEAIGEVDPITFRYQPGLGPYGQQFGVSAQQLEQTSLGPQLVREGPDGFKRVDTGGAAMASLAATAEQERRLRALEMQVRAGEAQQLAELGPRRRGDPLQPTVSGPMQGAA